MTAPRAAPLPGAALLTWLLALLAVVVGTLLPASAARATPVHGAGTSSQAADGHRVVLIGTSGLRWDDVDPATTPALWSLLTDGSQAATTIRSIRRTACPVDGWLAVSAGRRAADLPPASGQQCRPVTTPGRRGDDVVVPGWRAYVEQADGGDYASQPGLLAELLTDAGVPYTAIGPGAALALASTADGALRGGYSALPGDGGDVSQLVAEQAATHRLVVLDAGAVRDPADLPEDDPDRDAGPRAEQVAQVEAVVAAALLGVPDDATLVVASLADSGQTPHLQLFGAMGPTPPGAAQDRYSGSLLGTGSTRQPGLIQVTDLMPTLVELLGVEPPGDLPGATIVPEPESPDTAQGRLDRLIDLDDAAVHIQTLVPPFFNGLVLAQILLYGAGTLALRKEWGGIEGRRRVLAVLRRVAIVFSAVPVSTFLANLVPWWRTDHQLLWIVAAVCAAVAVIATVAMLGPWGERRLGPLGFIGGVTAAVLAVDVATGSRLQISSLMGLQPLVGGRFYGLGNVEFALFATGSLMLAASLADAALRVGRRALAVAVVVAVGAVAVVIDGTPGLGSDFGGPPAMIPAFLLMALLVAGVRITWQRLVVIGGFTVVAVALICVVDWLRPAAERTHLGRFVQTVIDGGALPVITRKAAQNWEILTSSYLTLLVPFGAVFIAVILMRPVAWGAPALQRTYEASPTLKHGLISLLVMLAIGFAVNDSGTVVPAIGAVLAIPLLIAASVRTLEMADDETRRSTSTSALPSDGPRAARAGGSTGSDIGQVEGR